MSEQAKEDYRWCYSHLNSTDMKQKVEWFRSLDVKEHIRLKYALQAANEKLVYIMDRETARCLAKLKDQNGCYPFYLGEAALDKCGFFGNDVFLTKLNTDEPFLSIGSSERKL